MGTEPSTSGGLSNQAYSFGRSYSNLPGVVMRRCALGGGALSAGGFFSFGTPPRKPDPESTQKSIATWERRMIFSILLLSACGLTGCALAAGRGRFGLDSLAK